MNTLNYTLPWRKLLIWPALLLILSVLLFVAFDIDRRVADSLYQAAIGFPYQHSDSYEFWTHWLPRKIAAFCFFGLLLIVLIPHPVATWRKKLLSLGFGLLAMLAASSTVGMLKANSGIACPVQHAQYGGTLTEDYVGPLPLFISTDFRCWPAGHATNGLAFMALFFGFSVIGEKRSARLSLTLALLAGNLLGLAQVIRGQHFLSHQLWSMAICWFVPLALFWLIDQSRRWQQAMRRSG